MNAKTNFLANDDGSYTAFIGPSGSPKSMLDEMTPDETEAMMAWSEQQPRSPGGSVDLMAWPGWESVMVRRFKARFGVEQKQPAS